MDDLKQRFDEGIRSLPFPPPEKVRRRRRHRTQAELATAAVVLIVLTAVAVGVSGPRDDSATLPAAKPNPAPVAFDCRPASATRPPTVLPTDPFPASPGLTASDLGTGWVPMEGGMPLLGMTGSTGVLSGGMPLLDDSYLPAWTNTSLGPKGHDPDSISLFLPSETHATASRYAFYGSNARAPDLVRSVVIEYPAGEGKNVIAELRQAPGCGVPGWSDYKILSDTKASGHELLLLANPQSSSPMLKMAVGRVGDYFTVVQHIPARSPVDLKRVRQLGARAIERLVAALPDPHGPAPTSSPPLASRQNSATAPGLLTAGDVGPGWENDPPMESGTGELNDLCNRPIDVSATSGVAATLFRRTVADKLEIVGEQAQQFRTEAAATAVMRQLRKSATDCKRKVVPAVIGGDESLLMEDGGSWSAIVRVGAQLAFVDCIRGPAEPFPGGQQIAVRLATRAGERL